MEVIAEEEKHQKVFLVAESSFVTQVGQKREKEGMNCRQEVRDIISGKFASHRL